MMWGAAPHLPRPYGGDEFFPRLMSIPAMQKAVIARLDDILGYSGQSDDHDAENAGESK
jgi:hypothetical protein